MEKFELDKTLADEIRARALGDGFMKLVQSVRRNGKTFRISLRPVLIGGTTRYQAEMNDEGQVRVKNLDAAGAAEGLEEIIAQKGARDLHLMTAAGDLHVRVTRKGHVLVSRSAEMDRAVKVQPHDRVKKLPLTSFDASALLRVIGLSDGEGRVRASMRGKYDQVNEFLKVVEDVLKDRADRKLQRTASSTWWTAAAARRTSRSRSTSTSCRRSATRTCAWWAWTGARTWCAPRRRWRASSTSPTR